MSDMLTAKVVDPTEERDDSYLQDDITNLTIEAQIFETNY